MALQPDLSDQRGEPEEGPRERGTCIRVHSSVFLYGALHNDGDVSFSSPCALQRFPVRSPPHGRCPTSCFFLPSLAPHTHTATPSPPTSPNPTTPHPATPHAHPTPPRPSLPCSLPLDLPPPSDQSSPASPPGDRLRDPPPIRPFPPPRRIRARAADGLLKAHPDDATFALPILMDLVWEIWMQLS